MPNPTRCPDCGAPTVPWVAAVGIHQDRCITCGWAGPIVSTEAEVLREQLGVRDDLVARLTACVKAADALPLLRAGCSCSWDGYRTSQHANSCPGFALPPQLTAYLVARSGVLAEVPRG